MSDRELARAAVLRRVRAGELSLQAATPLLGVSYRQAKRLAARYRKAHFGELVQLDGSFHDWLEGRGPRGCLMAMVDDATGNTMLRLGAEETIWAAAGVLQAWMAAYGIPRALYTDWKNVYLRAPTTNERARGEAPLTQFGRMCAKLGIRVIGASSPQAKGRVERGHGTHQDRLIKKLRVAGIGDAEAANAFLLTDYLPAHNGRFAIAPTSAIDHHAPRRTRRITDANVFCLETTRSVGADHVVQYEGRGYQLDPGMRGRVPARSKVLVRETEDGVVRLLHVKADGHERLLRWTPAVPRARRPPPARPWSHPKHPRGQLVPAIPPPRTIRGGSNWRSGRPMPWHARPRTAARLPPRAEAEPMKTAWTPLNQGTVLLVEEWGHFYWCLTTFLLVLDTDLTVGLTLGESAVS